jgi:DNA-binding XRE family transcriptional regulator
MNNQYGRIEHWALLQIHTSTGPAEFHRVTLDPNSYNARASRPVAWSSPDKPGTVSGAPASQPPIRENRSASNQAPRLKLALTQEQLAETADLHWTYISGIERGVRNVSIVNLFHIAVALKVRVRDLVREL